MLTSIIAFAQPNDYCISQSSCTSSFIQRADRVDQSGNYNFFSQSCSSTCE